MLNYVDCYVPFTSLYCFLIVKYSHYFNYNHLMSPLKYNV